jgi:hypothetical protein
MPVMRNAALQAGERGQSGAVAVGGQLRRGPGEDAGPLTPTGTAPIGPLGRCSTDDICQIAGVIDI